MNMHIDSERKKQENPLKSNMDAHIKNNNATWAWCHRPVTLHSEDRQEKYKFEASSTWQVLVQFQKHSETPFQKQ